MASMKLLSLTCILVLSGLVVLGTAAVPAPTPCPVVCIQGGYITCDNYPNQKLDGCDCECARAPKNGVNCVLHLLVTGNKFNCTGPAHA